MRESNKTFGQSFRKFITYRLMEDLDILLSNNELKELYEESNMHFENARIAVSKGSKELFEICIEEYKSAQAAAGGIVAEISYLQGMRDMYSLIKILEATGEEGPG